MLVFAVITDVLDGYLSRKLNQQTQLSRVLDPLADKITLIVLLASGVMFGGFPKTLVFDSGSSGDFTTADPASSPSGV